MWVFERRVGVFVLSCLYYLQGFPFGFASNALPLIIDSSYTEASMISIATYPYAAKVLWSPIVDAFWLKSVHWGSLHLSLGRRKSWIVPCTLLAAPVFLYLANLLDTLLADRSLDGTERAGLVWGVILSVLLVNLLMATQDVATDGWALTLDRDYLPFAATCQTMGLTAGCTAGFPVLLALTSKHLWGLIGEAYHLVWSDSDVGRFEAMSAGGVLRAQAVICVTVAVAVACFVSETSSGEKCSADVSGGSNTSSWSEATVLYKRVLKLGAR